MKDVSAKTLTITYLIALAIVAGLSIACHVVLQRELGVGHRSAALINLSGRQRMLSQRIAGTAAQYQFGEASAQQDLIVATEEFARDHNQLLAEVNAAGSDDAGNARIRSLYNDGPTSLDVTSRSFIATARQVAALPSGSAAARPLLAALFASARYPLLHDLDTVVTLRQQDSEARIQRLQRLQNVILAVVLLTLMIEALAIFRPMVGRIVAYTTRLFTLATTDSLTGCSNRRSFMDAGLREVERAQRNAKPVSLLAIDLDHFKSINDTYGHAGGDAVLCAICERFGKELRQTDVLGRLGGEEFGAILPGVDLLDAQLIAVRLRAAVESMTVLHNGARIRVTVSIGLSDLASCSDESISAMLSKADTALYAAKHAGRNRVAIAPPDTAKVFPRTATVTPIRA